MKLVEVITKAENKQKLQLLLTSAGFEKFFQYELNNSEYCSVRLTVGDDKRQLLTDSILKVINPADVQIIVSPIETVISEADEEEVEVKKSPNSTREELYSRIDSGTQLDSNFLFFVIASVVVVSVGLLENNVAVIIGAMVIAPLLGPNVALAFASVLGDRDLLVKSIKINFAGLSLAVLSAVIIGCIWPVTEPNSELMARTNIGYDGIILALASGAAAVLSLTSGVSSALVGVMVAVALLPPAVTFGMLLASGQTYLASGAALLFAGNVISVNLAASLVFILKGIKPRTWLEKRKANQSIKWALLFWSGALIVLLLVIYFRQIAVEL